jgi:succinate dehydrogenase / fumarate reductase, cytochrome b subunit
MVTAAVNHYFRSSIGRKQLVAITGLLLCGFLVGHLSGNLLLLVSSDAFNLYAYKLASLGVLLYLIEAVLAFVFILHLGLAVKLNLENAKARGKYSMKVKTGRGTTFMSQTMPITGLILLAFLIFHLMNLKFGSYYETTVDGIVMRDLTRTTVEYFQSVGAVVWYVVAMTAAGMHTAHGFASAFQSLGWNHPKYMKNVKRLSYLYAVVVAGGFSFLAIWCHVKGV